ncbi:MAG: putative Na+/H+ antiporter [Deltaproteobacteria bacterium]|nr:putative Na+/H+ antiporter [Deltaproteobacteria bacterium]
MNRVYRLIFIGLIFLSNPFLVFASGGSSHGVAPVFPPSLESYQDNHLTGLWDILVHRVAVEPLNLIVSVIFLLAIIHTFLSSKFQQIAHHLGDKHRDKISGAPKDNNYKGDVVEEVNFGAEIFHFLGEVEVVFGMWVVVLILAMTNFYGWHAVESYFSSVNYTEPMFVVVIMTLAATRPIMQLTEKILGLFAKLGKSTPAAWWFSILTLGPIMGSFITEPAAMTISALILAKQFYDKKPSAKFAYATIGLLFVNISVGGTLSHFAAPPVLMVAGKWDWNFVFMLGHFGWKAFIGIMLSNLLYLFIFKNEFQKLKNPSTEKKDDQLVDWEKRDEKVPAWITIVHMIFMFWTVYTAHDPPFFIGGFLFFLGFTQATGHHQNRVDLKPALLVGFFLAGLVTHGGVQAWWIAPILGSLGEVPLMMGATFLTAFNDNAAITYLSTLVPNFSEGLKYAVVAGAVTGGGLTVIANAPNPAGQSILQKYFPDGVSPLWLAVSAMVPTIIMGLCFMLIR